MRPPHPPGSRRRTLPGRGSSAKSAVLRTLDPGDNRPVRPIYVTGHRNPDTDSIASAIGYAELKARLDPNNRYIPVRLGDCNAQTQWLLQRSGAPAPLHLSHVMLRAGDVMQESFPVSRQ